MIASFTYTALPARVLFGAGRVAEVAEAVRSLGCARALVLSTPEQRGIAELVSSLLGELSAGLFPGAAMHTPVEVTEAALRPFAELRADCVVSVGGGSTTGLGKAIALRTDAAGRRADDLCRLRDDDDPRRDERRREEDAAHAEGAAGARDLRRRADAHAAAAALRHERHERHRACGRGALREGRQSDHLADGGGGDRARSPQACPRSSSSPADRDARSEALYGAWLCGTCLGVPRWRCTTSSATCSAARFDLPHAETHAIVLPHAAAYNAPAAPEAMRRVARALGADEAARGALRSRRRSSECPSR